VEEVIGAVRPLAASRSVTLQVEPMEPVQIKGDPDHLRRLFLNLVDNGIKYTPAGGSVEVSLHKDDRWAYLGIKDSGMGVAPEDQEKIFRRFYRAARARSQGEGGSGLGLAIAKSIAEAHGGRIQVESAEGQGSLFTVLLPLSS
jgi:signal transduction histidine kinase